MPMFAKIILLASAPLLLAGCSGGGSLSLDSVRKIAIKGSPFVSMNQGGRALIVEQGKTATTGVHGWVAVQSVAQRNLSSPGGTSIILNNVKPPTQRGLANE